jgi:NPCBM/NEW2 domain
MKHAFVFFWIWLLGPGLIFGSPEVESARRILDAWHKDQPEPGDRHLHIVAWRSQDRDFAADHRTRLQRILEHIREFYAVEMEHHGFGRRTIRLSYNEDGKLIIHEVTGTRYHSEYGKPDGQMIRNECLPILRAAGIDADRETILIFTNLVEWNPDSLTFSHNSPYYAGGSHRSGTAWQLDSAELDTRNLSLTEPLITDGEYGRISLGRHNSIFIGGIAHELGHALGLPHCRALPNEDPSGRTALMGSGNRTYAEELRGEGPGTFLTLAHALRLASHPQFSGSVKGMNLPVRATLVDRQIELAPDQRSFAFQAKIESPIPAYAMIAYLDPEGGGDYDAHTVVAIPDEEQRISLACHASALVPGKTGTLRLVTCLVNGATSSEQHDYRVAEDGTVDLETMRISFAFAPFLDAVEAGELEQAEAYAVRWPVDSREHRIARSILAGRSGEPRSTIMASAIPGDQPTIALSRLTPEEVTVGWGKPAYDHLPRRDSLLLAGGELFETGIYAHAEASHVYDLEGTGWKTLTGACGLPAGGGSVVFAILSDGHEVFRSGRITGGAIERFRIDLSQTHRLELRTEDAGDGKTADWGLWLGVELSKR